MLSKSACCAHEIYNSSAINKESRRSTENSRKINSSTAISNIPTASYSGGMTTKKPTRKLIDDDHEASRKLLQIWNAKKDSLDLTQETAGEKIGLTQGAVGHCLHGRMAMNEEICIKWAKLLHIDVEQFAPLKVIKKLEAIKDSIQPKDNEGNPKFFEVPFIRSNPVSQGSGAVNEPSITYETLSFSYSWANRVGLTQAQIDCLIVVPGKGDSMDPEIKDGEAVLTRTDLTEVENGKVYAFTDPDGLDKLKRLYLHGDVLLAVSDNPNKQNGPEIYKGATLKRVKIIGQAQLKTGRIN